MSPALTDPVRVYKAAVAGLCLLAVSLMTGPAALAAPDLIITVAVDQLRRDRLNDDLPGGLGRMIRQGRVYSEAILDHAITSTCPGHSVILTGVNPDRTGIPGNEYIDMQSWKSRYCLGDSDNETQVIGSDVNRSPRNLRVTTLGDWLQKQFPDGKVMSVGGKDRAVVAMGGHDADGAFWFDQDQGRFTSSGYYMESLPEYVREFNGTDPLSDGVLSTLPPVWEHDAGPWRADDYPGENDKYRRHSAHPLGKGDLEAVASQFWSSPWQDRAVLQLARKVIETERLGDGASPDLLAIALSATDVVGHLYGPFSSEGEDNLRRLDKELGNFLAWLDDRFGKDRVTLVLTADHGVAELPEWRMERGANQCPVEPGRVNIYGFIVRLYWYIYSRFTMPFGLPTDLVKFAGQQVSVNRAYVEDHGLDVDEVMEGLKRKLEAEPSVKKVWTRSGIMSGGKDARLYRNSLVTDKSGDLIIQVHSGCIIRDSHGTNHGTPYHYDGDIPLIFYGRGVQRGQVPGEAHSIDIAPTLARLIRLDYPPDLDGQPLSLSD